MQRPTFLDLSSTKPEKNAKITEEEDENTKEPNPFSMRNFSIAMLILLLTTIIHYYINNGYNTNLEIEKCPFCYGMELCKNFENNEISFENLTYYEQFSNLLNAKNVYVANYNNEKVIIKKLGHKWELDNIDKVICETKNTSDENCPPFEGWEKLDYTNDIMNFLLKVDDNTQILNLRVCSQSALDNFMNVIFAQYTYLNSSEMTANIWTILLANAEPLMLKILNDIDWPVPKYYGACGRLIVEEYCGQNLNSIKEDSWFRRAKVALELLLAADAFTNNHPMFRFYLTDISADNVAVTDDDKIKFIDLENVIIADKMANFEDSRLHESKHLDCENCYAFSSEEICSHTISDHNFFSVCKLLLSKNSPWPMMKNGLLHSTPKNVTDKYPKLLELIEICAESSPDLNRFKSSKLLIQTIEKILDDKTIQ